MAEQVISKTFKIAVCVLVVAGGLHVVGFSTTSWKHKDWSEFLNSLGIDATLETQSGLWKHCVCVIGICQCISYDQNLPDTYDFLSVLHGFTDVEPWFDAVRALECIGLVGLAVTGLLMLTYTCSFKNALRLAAAGLSFISGICILAGTIVYGAKVEEDLHYSFALCIIAAVLVFVTGVIIIVDIRAPPAPQAQPQFQVNYVTGGQAYMAPQQHILTSGVQAPGVIMYNPPPYTSTNMGISPQGYAPHYHHQVVNAQGPMQMGYERPEMYPTKN